MILSKLVVAKENLRMAIRLYLQDSHIAPVLTLANAAREVVAVLGERNRIETLHGEIAKIYGKTPVDIVRDIPSAANFVKHSKHDPDAEKDVDEDIVRKAIYLAAVDFNQVAGRMPKEAEIYTSWIIVCTIKSISSQSQSNQRWMKRILRFCPGLRSANWCERKRMGLNLLHRYLAGEIAEEPNVAANAL